ncbi:MAG: hypothetical protein WAU75_10855 [Solirubrobacteraceae bacterium]
MRRVLFTILACSALFVAVPAVALAHGGRNHHKRHQHARVRHEHFVGHDRSGDVNAGNPGDANRPTAGTVTSFANNVLTITLTNGDTVSGEVTNASEIKCDNSAMQNGDNDGDDNGVGDERGDAVFHHGDGGGDNGDQGEDNADNQMCTITPGMAVANAELTINGAGAFWNEVELVSSSTTSPSQS